MSKHLSCLHCSSSDAMYDYGTHYYCFSCNKRINKEGDEVVVPKKDIRFITELVPDLERRGLRADTTNHYKYQGGFYDGKKVHVANYYKDGVVKAQHVRFDEEKDFRWIGDTSELELFGQNKFPSGGLKIVITEGEIDAMSMSQVQDNKYPVVSVPSGSSSAKKYIKQNLEWIETFNEVILAFDADDAGQKAIEEVAPLISPNKIKVADLGQYKDYNEMLLAGKGQDMIRTVFNAQSWRPDGIVAGKDLTYEQLSKPIDAGVPYPWPDINEMLYGGRTREITLWTSGSGLGKSSILRELQFHYNEQADIKMGIIFLEESIEKTAQGFIALKNNIPLFKLRFNPKIISAEKYKQSMKEIYEDDKIYFYDHFGSLDCDTLISKIRYMRLVLDVDYIWLDHISIVISGNESSDERKDIDILMTKMRQVVEETGVGIHAVVHLKRKDGTPYNEGGTISLTDMRGSASLEQLSDNVIGLERNQLAEDTSEANTTVLKVLKCRETGLTGKADSLLYNRNTGRMLAVQEVIEY